MTLDFDETLMTIVTVPPTNSRKNQGWTTCWRLVDPKLTPKKKFPAGSFVPKPFPLGPLVPIFWPVGNFFPYIRSIWVWISEFILTPKMSCWRLEYEDCNFTHPQPSLATFGHPTWGHQQNSSAWTGWKAGCWGNLDQNRKNPPAVAWQLDVGWHVPPCATC